MTSQIISDCHGTDPPMKGPLHSVNDNTTYEKLSVVADILVIHTKPTLLQWSPSPVPSNILNVIIIGRIGLVVRVIHSSTRLHS